MAFSDKVAQFETDADIVHNITHGTKTQTVTTEGGQVPTIAKVIEDNRQRIDGQTVAYEVAFNQAQIDRASEFSSDQNTRASQFNSAQSARAQEFQLFLDASGFEYIGEYEPGLVISRSNQYFTRDGKDYTLGASTVKPYTTTGDWDAEQAIFVLRADDAALRQELAGPGGADLIGMKDGRNISQALMDAVNVKNFGAKGNQVTDDTQAFRDAIAYCKANKKASLYIPVGVYLISESLDLTTGNISIYGDSSGLDGSVILGNTGEDYVLDYTGSTRWVSLRNFFIRSIPDTSNPSANGILFSRTNAGTLNGEHYIGNVRVRLISNPSANGGFGGVAFTTIGAESMDFVGVYFAADVPLFASSSPRYTEYFSGQEVTLKQITSKFQTITEFASSNTENSFKGACISVSGLRSAVHMRNAAAWDFDIFISRLISPQLPASETPPAFMMSNCNSLLISGDIEGYDTSIGFSGFNKNHSIKLYSVYRDGHAILKSLPFLTGGINTIDNCEIDIAPVYVTENRMATFIDCSIVTRIHGGEIALHCPLDLTQVPLSWMKGVKIRNYRDKTIRTLNENSNNAGSSYVNFTENKLEYYGVGSFGKSGFGVIRNDHNFSFTTLNATNASRETMAFQESKSRNTVLLKIEVFGEGAASIPFSFTKRILLRRSSPSAAYNVYASETVAHSDADGYIPAINLSASIVSDSGDPLEFKIKAELLDTGRTVGSLVGTVEIIGQMGA